MHLKCNRICYLDSTTGLILELPASCLSTVYRVSLITKEINNINDLYIRSPPFHGCISRLVTSDRSGCVQRTHAKIEKYCLDI
jgi:hypothetical protein